MLMKEKPDSIPAELMEYERFIEELLNDTKHPVHNRAHPLHKESVKALDEMMRRVEEMRNEWLSKG
ncbi:hypothetical protein ACH518_07855 [Methylomonas sp. HW2-6]